MVTHEAQANFLSESDQPNEIGPAMNNSLTTANANVRAQLAQLLSTLSFWLPEYLYSCSFIPLLEAA